MGKCKNKCNNNHNNLEEILIPLYNFFPEMQPTQNFQQYIQSPTNQFNSNDSLNQNAPPLLSSEIGSSCSAQITAPPYIPPQIYMNSGLFINYTSDLLNSTWNFAQCNESVSFDTNEGLYTILNNGMFKFDAKVTFSYGALTDSIGSILIRNVDGTVYNTTSISLPITGHQNSKQISANITTSCLNLKAGDKIRLSMGNPGIYPYLLQSVDPITSFTLTSC